MNLNLKHNFPLLISLAVVTASLPLALFVAITQQTNTQTNASVNKTSWEFNMKGNLESWTGAGFAKKVEVANGYLKAVTVNTNGKEIMLKSALYSPLFKNLPGQTYPQIKLRMKVSGNQPLPKEVLNWSNENLGEEIAAEDINNIPYQSLKGKMIFEYYFRSNNNPNTKAKISAQLFVDTVEDGKYHIYTIDLNNEPAWIKNFIKQIKLTPTLMNPRTVYVDWVRFTEANTPTPTPTPVQVTELPTTEFGKVVRFAPKIVQAEVQDNVLGTSTSCRYNADGSPSCMYNQTDPGCPNGEPVSGVDPCGCPKWTCPTPTPTPVSQEDKFALQTEDGRRYLLIPNYNVVPPCINERCPLRAMPQKEMDFSQYLNQTVLIEGVLQGNFQNDKICTQVYPPTCFPGYPYPSTGTFSVNTINLAVKYATGQGYQGYLSPAQTTYVGENVHVFSKEKQNILTISQPTVPSEPQVLVLSGENDNSVEPSYAGNVVQGYVPGSQPAISVSPTVVPPYPGAVYARSSTINLGAFADNLVRIKADGYYVGAFKTRFFNVYGVEPVSVTSTPAPTVTICFNPVKTMEYFNSCGNDSYQYAKYICHNGYTGVIGSPAQCQSTAQLSSQVQTLCDNQCLTPTPSVQPVSCGITNCHGTGITCGEQIPVYCPEMYQAGDRCRKFADCQRIRNQCVPVLNTQFQQCKSCVQLCQQKFSSNQSALFSCEAECGN